MADPETTAAALRASIGGVREPHAPGPAATDLRAAYLGLLKLALTDLTGPSTVSVGPTPDGTAVARELSGEQRRLRAVGLDWPLQGVTMAGLRRLDDLQRCVESVLEDGVPGDLIEAGTWRGGSSILMRATLDTAAPAPERTVWVADSFQGFPRGEEGLNRQLEDVEFLAVSEQEVRDNFARYGVSEGVRFVPGFFEDSLAGLRGRDWAIVRLDADSYDATRLALEVLYPGLAEGGHLVVDDYVAAEECGRAVDEFRAAQGITEPLQAVDWTCARWRKGTEWEPVPVEPLREAEAPEPPAAPASDRLSVPTAHEVGLDLEIAQLRDRLAAAERELERARDAAGSYETSLSWRATRPLRAARAALRGRR